MQMAMVATKVGIENGGDERFLQADIAVNVFDGDGGVVNQDADGEGEAAEGHDVDGFAEEAQDAQRGEDGEWNGNANDKSAAPTAEEEQNHEAGEAGGDKSFAFDTVDRGTHEDGLIAEGNDFEFGRNGGEHAREGGFDGIDDIERGGFAVASDGDENAAETVGADDVALDAKAIVDLRDILNIDGGAVDGFNGEVVELVKLQRAGVDADLIFGLGDLRGAGGEDEILQSEGVGDIDG